ncbi:MAG: hypothetical protein AAF602_10395 [Myxococcota bacterium]
MMWLWLLACGSDEVEPALFNAEEQDITVLVRTECTESELAPAELVLLSNVAELEIGRADVTPGCGPVGTMHVLTIQLFDDQEALVDEAQVVTVPESVSDLDGDGENEPRDRSTYTLDRDLSDPGFFDVELTSLGAPGEERDDRFRIRLLTFPPEDDDDGGILSGITQ